MLPLRRLLASPALRLGGGIARMQCTKASRALRVAGHAVTEPTERLAPRKGERRDSIDERTLHDRAMHDLRMQRAPVDADIYKEIQRLSLGRFKGWHSQRLVNARRARAAKLLASAPAVLGRRGVLVEYDELSALNREALPEVALLGHANCGKSALLNALGAEPPKKSRLAAVHSRAGWTAHLSFVRVVKAGHDRGQGAVMLVDTPGYGFSVGVTSQLRHFRALIDQYMHESRHLTASVLLIDCTRGLCAADREVLHQLWGSGMRVLPVLTKTDLLDQAQLMDSHTVVHAQLTAAAAEAVTPDGFDRWDARATTPSGVPRLPRQLPMLSSHFCTGINELWQEIWQLAPPSTNANAAERLAAADRIGAKRLAAAEAAAVEAAARIDDKQRAATARRSREPSLPES